MIESTVKVDKFELSNILDIHGCECVTAEDAAILCLVVMSYPSLTWDITQIWNEVYDAMTKHTTETLEYHFLSSGGAFKLVTKRTSIINDASIKGYSNSIDRRLTISETFDAIVYRQEVFADNSATHKAIRFNNLVIEDALFELAYAFKESRK